MTGRQSLFENNEAKIEGYVCGNSCPRYRKHLKTKSELYGTRSVPYSLFGIRILLIRKHSQIEAFLTHPATQRNVAGSTQNQAMNALVFLYKQVLDKPLEKRIDAIRSGKKRHIPVVLSADEVKQVLARPEGVPQLAAKILYGSGLRIAEAVRLRVQDLDFEYKQIPVRSGKGDKDRMTTFSAALMPLPRNHLDKVKSIQSRHSLGFRVSAMRKGNG